MTWVDWTIVIVLAISVLSGLQRGFFRSVFALGGLLTGLALAAWNYGAVARIVMPVVRLEPVADAIGFLFIALAVMCVAGLAGSFLAKLLHGIGLGCLDRLAGGVFGFLQGALLVMVCVLVAVAFFPQARWLTEARLPRHFFAACHVSTHMSPEELARRVREGLKGLEEDSPAWMHPENPRS